MKYRGLIFVTAAIGLMTFVMPALSNMMWSDFANDPQYQEIAKSVKQMHELTMQIAGIMYMPGILSIIISTLLLGGNLVVDSRLNSATEDKKLAGTPKAKELTRQEWLDIIFHQDAVDFETLARREAIQELREEGVLEAPAKHSRIEERLGESAKDDRRGQGANANRSKRKHGSPTSRRSRR
jgi:hypothetical protein